MPVRSDIQIITAASILGLKPNGVEQLPSSLLSNGLQDKLRAQTPIIEVPTLNHLYTNDRDKRTAIINTESLKSFSVVLSKTIQQIQLEKNFLLILGGDCSILIGIMLALKSKGIYGLFFVDAHADFYEPEKSITGEAADMDLALVTGRGPNILTDINGAIPYVKDENVVHIGQRDMEEAEKFHSRDIRATNINCFDATYVNRYGVQKTMDAVRQKISHRQLDGFWIHFDTDVIEDESNPAVEYHLPGGLSFQECEDLLKNLIAEYNIAGMSVTIFNPAFDEDGKIAGKLTALLANGLR